MARTTPEELPRPRRLSTRRFAAVGALLLMVAGSACLMVGRQPRSCPPDTCAVGDGIVHDGVVHEGVVTTGAASVGGPREPGSRARTPGGRPQRVTAAAIGLDAPVVPVNLVHATLTPPDPVWRAGWWAGRAGAGAARGPVVLVGHSVSGGGGVFGDLRALSVGASITVTTPHGRARYTVRSVRTPTRAAFARLAPRLTRPGGAPRLVLVTCSGWDGSQFLENVVVVARK